MQDLATVDSILVRELPPVENTDAVRILSISLLYIEEDKKLKQIPY